MGEKYRQAWGEKCHVMRQEATAGGGGRRGAGASSYSKEDADLDSAGKQAALNCCCWLGAFMCTDNGSQLQGACLMLQTLQLAELQWLPPFQHFRNAIALQLHLPDCDRDCD